MVRYKGQVTSRQIDRDFPHQVEIPIPPGGLRKQLDLMYQFCRGRAFMTRGANRRVGDDAMRWCFADPTEADAFHAQFGGKRITIEAREGHRHGPRINA